MPLFIPASRLFFKPARGLSSREIVKSHAPKDKFSTDEPPARVLQDLKPDVPVVGIDFDDTIATNNVDDRDISKSVPKEGVVEALNRVYNAGFQIVIWTGNPNLQSISEWLKRHNIPNNGVKPKDFQAAWYVDDRALSSQHHSWAEIADIILQNNPKDHSPHQTKSFELNQVQEQPFTTYKQARKLAKKYRREFHEGMKAAADGGKVISHIKSESSFRNKTEKRGKNPKRVSDVLRGAILVDDKNDVQKVVQNLYNVFTVRKVDHKIWPGDFGYFGATHLDVVLDDVLIAEIQVMTKELWEAKKATRKIYSKYRGEKHPPKDEVEKAKEIYKEANEVQRKSLPIISTKALDPYGGMLPTAMDRAKEADFITLPKDVKGTNCGNCRFIDNDFCNHPKVQFKVNDRNCCKFWDSVGTFRAFEERREPNKEVSNPTTDYKTPNAKGVEVIVPDKETERNLDFKPPQAPRLITFDNLKRSRRQLERDSKALGDRKVGCLIAPLPQHIAKQITDWNLENIPDQHLAEDGREQQPHVTIRWGFKDSGQQTIDELKAVFQEHGPFNIKLGGASLFKGEEHDVLKLDVVSLPVVELHGLLGELFSLEESEFEFHPHVTLAYLDPSISAQYDGIEVPFANKVVTVDSLEFGAADGTKTVLSLNWWAGPSFQDLVLAKKSLEYDAKDSYLATCPRDESGHCLPQDEGDRSGKEKPKSKEDMEDEAEYEAAMTRQADEEAAAEKLAQKPKEKPKPKQKKPKKEEPKVEGTPEGYNDWKGSLTADEKTAFKYWGGGAFREIKQVLKNPEGTVLNGLGEPHSDEDQERYRRIGKAFKEAVMRAPQQDGTYYRGMHNLTPEQVSQFTDSGATVRFDASGSFTDDADISKRFAASPMKAKTDRQFVILKVSAPMVPLKPLVHIKKESEFIPKPGAAYRVVKSEETTTKNKSGAEIKGHIVHLEPIE